MISNILYLLLFFSQNGEKLKNASNNVPASVATGAVISWLPSDNCPCNTVIGAAIRIPPLIEFGTPFTNLSASFVIPININTNATRSCNAIIACILSGPFSNPFKYARVNGSVGVIHPGTTGSPNHPWSIYINTSIMTQLHASSYGSPRLSVRYGMELKAVAPRIRPWKNSTYSTL